MTAERIPRPAHHELTEQTADRATVDGDVEADAAEATAAAWLELPSVLKQAADSVVVTDREGTIEYVNPAFETCTGYTLHEAKGQTPRLLKSGLHDQPFYERLWARILAGYPFRAVFINRKKDGTLYYDDKTITPLKDQQGRITHFVSAGRDVTERMRAEEELRRSREQLRALAAHLQSVREEERTRIARQIHDELGQMLTGLKLDISWIAVRLPRNQAALSDKVQAIGQLIDTTIRSVQQISAELRPGILDHLGLVPAIEWQAKEFQGRTGIRCQVSADLAGYEPDRELSTALFRIFQEALTNIIRHANATAATINLALGQDRLILAVIDNGRGIAQRELTDANALGLLGMRERALLFGGEVTIAAGAEGGTTVTVSIPLRQPTTR